MTTSKGSALLAGLRRSRTELRVHTHHGRGVLNLPSGDLVFSITGSGPALLLVHGLGEDRHTWQLITPRLAQHYTVISVDLPGHGESPAPPQDCSIPSYASALRDLLVALGLHSASVMGHSMGGSIALQFGYQFPERTERLLLISSGGLGKEVTLALRALALPGLGTTVATAEKITNLTTHLVQRLPGSNETCLADLRWSVDRLASFVRTTRSVIGLHGQRVIPPHDASLLSAVPIFLAWGEQDSIVPPEHHELLAKKLSQATVCPLEGIGHFPHQEAPDKLSTAVEDFINSTTPAHYSDQRWRDLLAG